MKRLFEISTGYCPRCGSYYIEDLGESCRCPSDNQPASEGKSEVNKSLLSKWQSGAATL